MVEQTVWQRWHGRIGRQDCVRSWSRLEQDAGVDNGELTSIDWLVWLIELGLRLEDRGEEVQGDQMKQHR